jgi:hypothetical protein
MLRKLPSARPTLQRCAEVFAEPDLEYKTAPRAVHVLIEAASQHAEREAREEAERQASITRQRQRHLLFEEAAKELLNIKNRLFAQIRAFAETAEPDNKGILRLGGARLHIANAGELGDQIVAQIGGVYSRLNWDILAWALIAVACAPGRGMPGYTWSATLLYADQKNGEGFRWYEVGFWSIQREKPKHEPFGVEPTTSDLYQALGPGIHSLRVAYGPLAIDAEDEEEFTCRWIQLFSKAINGSLRRPDRMPIDLGQLLSA